MATQSPRLAYALAAALAAVVLALAAWFVVGSRQDLVAPPVPLSWQVVRPDGTAVSDADFDQVDRFGEGLAPASRGGRWGLVDATGAFVVAPAYEAISPPSEGRSSVQQDGRWGLIDRSGRVILAPAFHRIDPFQDGVAVVWEQVGTTTSGQGALTPVLSAGLVDAAGRIVVRPFGEQDPQRWLSALGPAQGRLVVERADGWALVDLAGQDVGTERCDQAEAPSEGRVAVRWGERWGFLDLQGQVVVPPRFLWARPFSEGRAAVGLPDGDGAFIDPEGEVIWAGFLDAGRYVQGRAPVLTADGWMLVDEVGRAVAPPRWSGLSSMHNGYAIADDLKDRYLLDRDGAVVLGPVPGLQPVSEQGVTLVRRPRPTKSAGGVQ